MPAPLRTAPTMMAKNASSRPMILRISTKLAYLLLPPLKQRGLQAQQRLTVQLADARFGDFQHGADLLQIQLLLVVEREHQLLALGQLFNGIDDGLTQRIV